MFLSFFEFLQHAFELLDLFPVCTYKNIQVYFNSLIPDGETLTLFFRFSTFLHIKKSGRKSQRLIFNQGSFIHMFYYISKFWLVNDKKVIKVFKHFFTIDQPKLRYLINRRGSKYRWLSIVFGNTFDPILFFNFKKRRICFHSKCSQWYRHREFNY